MRIHYKLEFDTESKLIANLNIFILKKLFSTNNKENQYISSLNLYERIKSLQLFFLARFINHEETWKYTNGSGWCWCSWMYQ